MKIKMFCAMLLSLVMMLSTSSSALAATIDPVERPYIIEPRAILFDQAVIGWAAESTVDFRAAAGNGKYIRVWYDNTDGTEVTVTLYQYGLFGIKTALDDFSVAGNSADYMVVDGGFFGDSATYYVLIESADGGAISGTLRVNQRTTAT